MPKVWIFVVACFLISCMSVDYKKLPVRFKAKGVSIKYDKEKDWIVYSIKRSRDNLIDVDITEFLDKGKTFNPPEVYLTLTVTNSGYGEVGMEYIDFDYADELYSNDRIVFSDYKSNFVYRRFDPTAWPNLYYELWVQTFKGNEARELAKKLLRLATAEGEGIGSYVTVIGYGLYKDSYTFTPKDKQLLKTIAEAWLKYFDNAQPIELPHTPGSL